MEYERLPFVEAVETLAGQAGVEVPRERSGRPQRDNSGLFAVMQRAERYYREQLRGSKPAVDYLKSRGLTGAVARDFGIGYAPESWDALQRALAAGDERQQAAARGGPRQQERAGQRLRPFPGPYPVPDPGHPGQGHRLRRPPARGRGGAEIPQPPPRRRSSTRAKSCTGCSRPAEPYENLTASSWSKGTWT